MKKRTKIVLTLAVLIVIWWVIAAPRKDLTIGEAYSLGETPAEITALQSASGDFSINQQVTATDLPGHDDVVFQDSLNCAFISCMDGWIWKVDLKTNKASRFADVPMNPTGMQLDPQNAMRLFFCASMLGGVNHPETEKVGLYQLNLATKEISPVVLKLPIINDAVTPTVYLPKDRPKFSKRDMNDANSRNFYLCNDMAISPDGNRIYMSEPIPLPNSAMGTGTIAQAIGLAPIGKMWLYDRKTEQVSLVLDHFTFVDGIILNNSSDSTETSVYFTETPKFRIMKANFETGTSEIMWDNLPGMPDGLERDEKGNVWAALFKKRSNLIGFIHKNPWIKPFFLRLPQSILPVSKETGLLAFSPDLKKPLFYSFHKGSLISDISAITPHHGQLYLSTFNLPQRGLHQIVNPLIK